MLCCIEESGSFDDAEISDDCHCAVRFATGLDIFSFIVSSVEQFPSTNVKVLEISAHPQ